MELIIVCVVLLIICLILGIDFGLILIFVGILAVIFVILLFFFFGFFLLRVFFCQKKKGRFLRIADHQKWYAQMAYYEIDGEEYRCVFPSEPYLRNQLYHGEKTLFVHRKKKIAYDLYSIATCVLGTLFGAIFIAIIIYVFVSV